MNSKANPSINGNKAFQTVGNFSTTQFIKSYWVIRR